MITRAELVEAVRSCEELQALAGILVYARRSLDAERPLRAPGSEGPHDPPQPSPHENDQAAHRPTMRMTRV